MRPFSRCRMARRRMYGSASCSMRMAVSTRVCSPLRSMAFCRARALITVARIPRYSARTRSIPCALAAVPRTMLPPPITSPSATPISCTARISSVSRCTTGGLMPKPCSPASASPLILSSTRRYLTAGAPSAAAGERGASAAPGCAPSATLLAQREAGEPANLDLLAGLGGDLGDQLPHRLVRVLDERLLQQRLLAVELV